MQRAFYTIVFLGYLIEVNSLITCHDYCFEVIGCSQDQKICHGKYCTYYQHRDLKNTQHTSLKRGCTNDTMLFYGPDPIQFGVPNRCIRHVNGDDEWTIALCDTRDYCNYICDTSIRDSSTDYSQFSYLTFIILFLQLI